MGTDQSKQLKSVRPSSNTNSSFGQSSNVSSNMIEQRQVNPAQSQTAPDTFCGKIVVVSKGEKQKQEARNDKEFLDYLLGHHFNPLLPKNSTSIPTDYQRIDSISMTNLSKIIQDYLREKSDLSAKEQHKIYEKIRKVDYVTAFMANLILEKEKCKNQTIDVYHRINKLKTLASIYQGDLERCLKTIETLNNLLDEEQRIEIDDGLTASTSCE